MHLLVIALAALFVRLGIWQLDRLDERRMENAVGESRLAETPVPVTGLLGDQPEPERLTHRRVSATGRFDPDNEVLIRSQVHLGSAGHHVITPLLLESGGAIMVNRGWVPFELDESPVEQASPPEGTVVIEGWLRPSQPRPALGRQDPEGSLDVMTRVDLARIEQQLPYPIADMYLVEMGERDQLPVPVAQPDFSDEGPHLGYALQWFGFAAIGLVGYLALLRRRLQRPQEGEVEMARSSTTS